MNFFFTFKRNSTLTEFNGKCILIDLFGETRSKNAMYFHCCSNNLV